MKFVKICGDHSDSDPISWSSFKPGSYTELFTVSDTWEKPMNKTGFFLKLIFQITVFLACTGSAHAAENIYACSIKDVLLLSGSGAFVTHGWAANYLNRKFFVERDTGKVIGTTALKARLKNFDKTHQPQLLQHTEANRSFKSITIYPETGEYTVLQIDEGQEGDDKPYFYHTAVGMILAGTCVTEVQQ